MRLWMSFWVDLSKPMHADCHWPWWISGERGDGMKSVCVGVEYPTEERAWTELRRAFGDDIKERFAEERCADWSPFADRFQRAKWMCWPDGSVGPSDAAEGSG